MPEKKKGRFLRTSNGLPYSTSSYPDAEENDTVIRNNRLRGDFVEMRMTKAELRKWHASCTGKPVFMGHTQCAALDGNPETEPVGEITRTTYDDSTGTMTHNFQLYNTPAGRAAAKELATKGYACSLGHLYDGAEISEIRHLAIVPKGYRNCTQVQTPEHLLNSTQDGLNDEDFSPEVSPYQSVFVNAAARDDQPSQPVDTPAPTSQAPAPAQATQPPAPAPPVLPPNTMSTNTQAPAPAANNPAPVPAQDAPVPAPAPAANPAPAAADPAGDAKMSIEDLKAMLERTDLTEANRKMIQAELAEREKLPAPQPNAEEKIAEIVNKQLEAFQKQLLETLAKSKPADPAPAPAAVDPPAPAEDTASDIVPRTQDLKADTYMLLGELPAELRQAFKDKLKEAKVDAKTSKGQIDQYFLVETIHKDVTKEVSAFKAKASETPSETLTRQQQLMMLKRESDERDRKRRATEEAMNKSHAADPDKMTTGNPGLDSLNPMMLLDAHVEQFTKGMTPGKLHNVTSDYNVPIVAANGSAEHIEQGGRRIPVTVNAAYFNTSAAAGKARSAAKTLPAENITFLRAGFEAVQPYKGTVTNYGPVYSDRNGGYHSWGGANGENIRYSEQRVNPFATLIHAAPAGPYPWG